MVVHLRNDLHTLRITGGESLMNPGAMQFFDLLEKEPNLQLEISLNSNLGVTTFKIDRLFDRIQSRLIRKN